MAYFLLSNYLIHSNQKNTQINNVSVTFINQNILETEDLQQQFDIIVSNPPYVRNLEKAEIRNLQIYFPKHLLFSDLFRTLTITGKQAGHFTCKKRKNEKVPKSYSHLTPTLLPLYSHFTPTLLPVYFTGQP